MNQSLTSILVLLSVLFAFSSTAIEDKNNQLLKRLRLVDVEAYQLAIKDLDNNSEKYINTLTQFEKEKKELLSGIQNSNSELIKRATELLAILDEGLLSNPLLDFDKIMRHK